MSAIAKLKQYYAQTECRLLSWLFVIFVCLTVVFVWPPAWVSAAASSVSDTYYHFHQKKPDSRIVFVAVDHEAVQRLGRWPWPRDVLAQGLAKLDQASVIALDMVFSEPTQAQQDQALSNALATMPIVGGFFLNGVVQSALNAEALDHLANSALLETPSSLKLVSSEQIELSIPSLLAGMSAQAALNTLPDPDARFRHYPVALMYQQMSLPALGTQSLRIFLNEEANLHGGTYPYLRIGKEKIALDTRGFARLNLYPPTEFATLSFAQLLDSQFSADSLRGKIVLVGVTEAGITDIRATPLGQYPGALMHGSFIANVLGQDSLYELGVGAMLALLVLTIGLCFLLSRIQSVSIRLGLYVALITALYLASVLAYRVCNIWVESAYLIVASTLSALLVEVALLGAAKAQTQQLRDAFSAYVPPAIVDRIAAQAEALKLGGEKKRITVLFSDIRGFTHLSESIAPEQLAQTMLAYFQPMTEVIFAEGGTLDKYIGDAIMALFNAPLDLAEHEIAACRAAAAMQKAQALMNTQLMAQGLPAMQTGIGINTGFAVVGNLGSHIRFNYTAIGDCVNLAARLESHTKTQGVDIIIGEETYQAVKDQLPCRALGVVPIAGKEKPQAAYALEWQKM